MKIFNPISYVFTFFDLIFEAKMLRDKMADKFRYY